MNNMVSLRLFLVVLDIALALSLGIIIWYKRQNFLLVLVIEFIMLFKLLLQNNPNPSSFEILGAFCARFILDF
jgi:hypothetical protein